MHVHGGGPAIVRDDLEIYSQDELARSDANLAFVTHARVSRQSHGSWVKKKPSASTYATPTPPQS